MGTVRYEDTPGGEDGAQRIVMEDLNKHFISDQEFVRMQNQGADYPLTSEGLERVDVLIQAIEHHLAEVKKERSSMKRKLRAKYGRQSYNYNQSQLYLYVHAAFIGEMASRIQSEDGPSRYQAEV